MSLQEREPVLLQCRFPLNTTVELFHDWLIHYHDRNRRLGFFDELPYDLKFITGTEENNAIVLISGNRPALDTFESMARAKHLSCDALIRASQVSAYNIVLSYILSMLPLTSTRIEVTTIANGAAFSHCLRLLLSQIGINWPSIASYRFEVLYHISDDAILVVDEEITG